MKRLAWFVGALVIFGCGGGSTNSPTLAPDPYIGFINASPNSSALDVMVNDSQIGNNVAYLGSSPVSGGVVNFLSYEPGDYDLSIQENSDPETQAIEVGSLQRDKSYVLFACGLVVPPSTEFDKRLRPLLFEFDRAKPNGDKARLVIVHSYNRAEGLETPSVDFKNPGDNPAINEQNIAFASAKQILIDAGAQTFVARRNGTEFDVTPESTFTFVGGKIYAAVISGTEGAAAARAPKITFIEILAK
jgi:hypothetical protein